MGSPSAKLTSEQRVLYARQISLPEIGEAGQRALCSTSVRLAQHSDTEHGDDAALTAYLERAGLAVSEGAADAIERAPSLPPRRTLAQLAGREELAVAASYLCASFEGVETIKAALDLGTPALLSASLTLSASPASRDPAP